MRVQGVADDDKAVTAEAAGRPQRAIKWRDIFDPKIHFVDAYLL